MSYSVHSTLGALMSSELAKAILEKHMPGISSHPDLPKGMHMTLMQISFYPEAVKAGLTTEKLKEIDSDLKSID